jgi:hypothetical protein
LLIAVPSALAAPTWHGAGLWIGVAVLGLVAMAIAAGLERRHARLHRLIVHVEHIVHDWE